MAVNGFDFLDYFMDILTVYITVNNCCYQSVYFLDHFLEHGYPDLCHDKLDNRLVNSSVYFAFDQPHHYVQQLLDNQPRNIPNNNY